MQSISRKAIGADTPAIVFLRTLEYANRLGSPHVTTLPGVYFEGEESAADSWQRSQDELAWRVEQAQQHDITFSVEAHVGSLAPNPREAERMVRGVPGLSLTLDYTHFTRIGLPDAEIEPLVAHAPRIFTFAAPGRIGCRLRSKTTRSTMRACSTRCA